MSIINLPCFLSLQGMLESAIADYSRALALNPRHSRAHYNRGFCYDGLNRVSEALQVGMDHRCVRALQIDEDFQAKAHTAYACVITPHRITRDLSSLSPSTPQLSSAEGVYCRGWAGEE